jgi:hypothetical protein
MMNNMFPHIQKLILGLLLIYTVNVLEASSNEQVAISYNPTDFTSNYKRFPGLGLMNMVVTGLWKARCSNDSGRSYEVSASEDPRAIEAIAKEIELSSSIYSDPATTLNLNPMVATHLVKGDAIFEQDRVSINLRIEDRQGCLNAEVKVSGPQLDLYKLIDSASKSLGNKMCTLDPNVQICQKPYYTVTTSQKTSTTAKVIENYRGINKDLKSYQEDKDTYYVYIDEDNAKIVQYHVDEKSTRKIHREKYELNMDSCQYEIEKEDKLIKNMGGRDILKSEDAGWDFEDDTKIYVNLPSSDKELSFTWCSLRENGL